jgi:predicted membrane protein
MRKLLKIAILCTAAHTIAGYLFRRQRRQFAGDRRHILVVQGGSQLRPSAEEISDAVVSVMMGGVVLDLRQTTLMRRPAHLDILCIMGGLELVVPEDWKVTIDVEPAMGGIRDARSGTVDPERPPDLVISGRVVMGGVDISSEMPGRRKHSLRP